MKPCRLCRRDLPLSDFYMDGRGVLSARCKSCHGLEVRTCTVCSASFIGPHNRKLCSEPCRKRWRPQTELKCKACGQNFIADRLSRMFCSTECSLRGRRMPADKRLPRLKATKEAIRAQSLVRYYIAAGKLIKPTTCSQCGHQCRVEAAHVNYTEPLLVRWLCRSCHVLWDKHDPKGGCVPRELTIASERLKELT